MLKIENYVPGRKLVPVAVIIFFVEVAVPRRSTEADVDNRVGFSFFDTYNLDDT